MLQRADTVSQEDLSGGINTTPNIYALQPGQTPNCMDIRFGIGGIVCKRYGSTTLNSVVLTDTAASGFSPDSGGTLGTGLISYWRLDDVSGNRLDAFGSNDLTDNNTVASTAGILGSAASFVQANSEYLSVPDNDSLSTGNIDFSVRAFFYVNQTGTMQLRYIASKSDKNASAGQIEWALFFNDSSDQLQFELYNAAGTRIANAFSATTATINTWHQVVAWVDTGALQVYVQIDSQSAIGSDNIVGGTGHDGTGPFNLGGLNDGSYWQGAIDEVGFWKKILTQQERNDLYNDGISNTYNANQSTAGFGMADFGAGFAGGEPLRWLVVAAGTGIFASSNRGVSFVTIATDRGADFQYFTISKNLLIATSETQNTVLVWDGSPGTFMEAVSSGNNAIAPPSKHALDFQGYLFLMNDSQNKLRIAYADNNFIRTDDWSDELAIPAGRDDEITGGAVLNKKAYVFTKTSIHRVSFVGGNPDFSEQTVKDSFGAVPGTIRKASFLDVGEVILFLGYDKKVHIFDGTDDRIISGPIEQDNGLSEVFLDNLNEKQLLQCHAELVEPEQVYRLWVVMAPSTRVTHALNLNLRTGAWYPYTQDEVQAAVMAQSDNSRILTMVKRDGFVHWADTGNTDAGDAIDDYYESRLITGKPGPGSVTKAQDITFYFQPTSSGEIHFQDKSGFTKTFSATRQRINLVEGGNSLQIVSRVEVPRTHNVYQYRISSSASTADPWCLFRVDHNQQELGMGKG